MEDVIVISVLKMMKNMKARLTLVFRKASQGTYLASMKGT